MIRGQLENRLGTELCEWPAIVLHQLEVENHDGVKSSRRWDGLIDTGADRSVIPEHVVQELAPYEINRLSVTGYDGQRTVHHVYYCRIIVPGLGTVDITPIATAREYLLLGRDFLGTLAGLAMVTDHRIGKWSIRQSSRAWRVLRAVFGL